MRRILTTGKIERTNTVSLSPKCQLSHVLVHSTLLAFLANGLCTLFSLLLLLLLLMVLLWLVKLDASPFQYCCPISFFLTRPSQKRESNCCGNPSYLCLQRSCLFLGCRLFCHFRYSQRLDPADSKCRTRGQEDLTKHQEAELSIVRHFGAWSLYSVASHLVFATNQQI